MLSLSTSCLSQSVQDGGELFDALEQYDIHGIELDCRLTASQFEQIKSCIGASRLHIESLHNYCPFPAVKPGRPPGGDYFNLSSPVAEERQLAVQWTGRTIENANSLEAGVVILHCGAVEMTSRCQEAYRLFRQGHGGTQEFRKMVTDDLARRERLKAPYLDALMFSLDRLMPLAEKYGVTLGLENRKHYFEMPDKAELDFLFEEFRGAPVGYWHDSGHAHVSELLGIGSQNELPECFSGHLIGLHLHDAKGLNDHLAPGTGDIDFAPFKPFLNDHHPVVIELAPGTEGQCIGQAVAHIRELGDFSETKRHPDFFLDLT